MPERTQNTYRDNERKRDRKTNKIRTVDLTKKLTLIKNQDYNSILPFSFMTDECYVSEDHDDDFSYEDDEVIEYDISGIEDILTDRVNRNKNRLVEQLKKKATEEIQMNPSKKLIEIYNTARIILPFYNAFSIVKEEEKSFMFSKKDIDSKNCIITINEKQFCKPEFIFNINRIIRAVENINKKSNNKEYIDAYMKELPDNSNIERVFNTIKRMMRNLPKRSEEIIRKNNFFEFNKNKNKTKDKTNITGEKVIRTIKDNINKYRLTNVSIIDYFHTIIRLLSLRPKRIDKGEGKVINKERWTEIIEKLNQDEKEIIERILKQEDKEEVKSFNANLNNEKIDNKNKFINNVLGLFLSEDIAKSKADLHLIFFWFFILHFTKEIRKISNDNNYEIVVRDMLSEYFIKYIMKLFDESEKPLNDDYKSEFEDNLKQSMEKISDMKFKPSAKMYLDLSNMKYENDKAKYYYWVNDRDKNEKLFPDKDYTPQCNQNMELTTNEIINKTYKEYEDFLIYVIPQFIATIQRELLEFLIEKKETNSENTDYNSISLKAITKIVFSRYPLKKEGEGLLQTFLNNNNFNYPDRIEYPIEKILIKLPIFEEKIKLEDLIPGTTSNSPEFIRLLRFPYIGNFINQEKDNNTKTIKIAEILKDNYIKNGKKSYQDIYYNKESPDNSIKKKLNSRAFTEKIKIALDNFWSDKE